MYNVAVIGNSYLFEKDNVFYDRSPANYHLGNFLKMLKDNALTYNINVHTLDQFLNCKVDCYLFVDYPISVGVKGMVNYLEVLKKRNLLMHNKNKSLLLIWESPVQNKKNWVPENQDKFRYVLSYSFIKDIGKKISFFYCVDSAKMFDLNKLTEERFLSKKLCCMIAGNKSARVRNSGYALRYKIIDYFNNKSFDSFDLYGMGWDSKVSVLNVLRMLKYEKKYLFKKPHVFKGVVDSKYDIYSDYKFVFAIENIRFFSGYVSEKIFDVFKAGVVPIYNGENVLRDTIPKNTFIDINDFDTLDDLYFFIKNMEYDKYLSYIKNIDNYLKSKQFKRFTHDYNCKKILSLIRKIIDSQKFDSLF